MRDALSTLAFALALSASSVGLAQDAGTGSLPAQHPTLPPVQEDAALPPGHPLVDPSEDAGSAGNQLPAVNPNDPMPPGHPPTTEPPQGQGPQGHGQGGSPNTRMANLPPTSALPAPELPSGTLEVWVVDGGGTPVPDAPVRVGSTRGGEPGPSREVRTGPDGKVRLGRMEVSPELSYRVSTEYEGARFGTMPFSLSQGMGTRAQVVRYAVDHSDRGMFLWDVYFEVRLRDDRLVVTERFHPVNLTAMQMGDTPPTPAAWVPRDGLRFRLPRGYTAFNVAPMMADLRLTAEGDDAVLRGSVSPTLNGAPAEVVFQYQVKIDGEQMDLATTLPLPIAGLTVVSEAPRGLTLSVDGLQPAEEDRSDGQRVLVTGLSRDPVMFRDLHIRVGGIPAAAGPEREVALGAVIALMGGALGYAFLQRRRGQGRRTREAVEAEKARVLASMEDLVRAHQDGDVGPITYERRRRELALWLASLLRELDATG